MFSTQTGHYLQSSPPLPPQPPPSGSRHSPPSHLDPAEPIKPRARADSVSRATTSATERGTARTGATSSDVVGNRALCTCALSDDSPCSNCPLVSPQVRRLPANPMSSSVKMAAVPSSFGVVTETMTVRTTRMKRTVVSLNWFLFGGFFESLNVPREEISQQNLLSFISDGRRESSSCFWPRNWSCTDLYKATTWQTTSGMLINEFRGAARWIWFPFGFGV